jgi:hypothetical protein
VEGRYRVYFMVLSQYFSPDVQKTEKCKVSTVALQANNATLGLPHKIVC